MSFADIINQTQKQLDAQGGGNTDKVAYPETKNPRLFFKQGEREIYLQILPSADLVSQFHAQARKIFLVAKSSQGKEIKSNFTLDAEPNPGSVLENKVNEWTEKQMIPSGYGNSQTRPKRVFIVNAVKIVMNQAQQWVQERDDQGNLVVRVFEMPQSGFANYIRKLGDQLYNTSGTELSFMDPNKAALVKISKPAQGQMEYPIEVYTNVILPPLGQGWENQLENLEAHAVPTERLENGLQWVQAFIDMKEGRKPNGGGQANTAAPQAPQAPVNPYAGQPVQPQAPVAPVAPQQPVQPNPYAAQQPVQPTAPVQPQQPVQPAQPTGLVEDSLPTSMTVDNSLANLTAAPQQPVQPTVPVQPAPVAPAAPVAPSVPVQDATQVPLHAATPNNNGLLNIDDMLSKTLGDNN